LRYQGWVPKLRVPPGTTAKQSDEPTLAALVRNDVNRLGVSFSTGLEGARLHPSIDDNGVRRFMAADVERFARELEVGAC
jgi:hypothetical protein